MKRTLLVLTILFSSLYSFSQVLPWDTAHIGGMGNGNMQFYSAKSYNNVYYVGAGDNSALSKVFYSYNGFYYDTLLAYDAVKDPSDIGIIAIDTAGGNMFFGSSNWTNGAKVYALDAGGTVTALSQPPFAGGTPNNFTYINTIRHFKIGGVDSLYVAYENYSNGAEVWKTSVAPPYNWTLALAPADSIGGIYDMTFFNGKIYAAAQLGYLFESADGVNWSINSSSANGWGNNDVECFNALGVHNNNLFVGTNNWNTGAEVRYSADGITWNTSAFTNLTSTSAISSVASFVNVYGGFWMMINGDYNSAIAQQQHGHPSSLGMSFGPIVMESPDNGLTFDRRSINNFGEFNNDGVYTLTLFQNNLFASGNSNYGGGGRVYHTCLAPLSSITSNLITDTTCVNSWPTFFGNSNGAVNMWWYDNGNVIANAQNTGIFFSTAGNHEIKLISYNYSCIDSVSKNIFVNPELIIDSVAGTGFVYCEGTPVTLVPAFTNGTGPFTYSWNDGKFTLDTNLIHSAFADYNTLYFGVNDKYGCYASISINYAGIIPSTDIVGNVTFSGGTVDSATVYLIAEGATASQYDTVYITNITSAAPGFFSFPYTWAGNYIIRVEADTNLYPNLINTYYGDHYLWDSALTAIHGCAVNDTNNVVMVEVTPVVGPGTISGTVYEGVGFGQKIMQGPGNPTPYANVIPGVPVKVGKNPGGSIVASGSTDVNGQYQFGNLPYDSYRIYTDIPGYPMDSSYAIVLSSGADSLVDLNYYVDSNSVYIDLTTGSHIANVSSLVNSASVHPNPSNGIVTVRQFFPTEGAITIAVSDMNGKTIFTRSVGNNGLSQFNYQLDLSTVEKGIYTLRVTQNGKSSINKIVIY